MLELQLVDQIQEERSGDLDCPKAPATRLLREEMRKERNTKHKGA